VGVLLDDDGDPALPCATCGTGTFHRPPGDRWRCSACEPPTLPADAAAMGGWRCCGLRPENGPPGALQSRQGDDSGSGHARARRDGRRASWRLSRARRRRPARPGHGADRPVQCLLVARAAPARGLLGVRDGRSAMTTALRIEAAAGATTGEVLAAVGFVAERQKGRQIRDPRSQAARAKENGVSTYTQRKLDALARKRPDLLDEVRAGRLSAHRAALEAGIIGMTTGDARASPDAPDRPPWQAVREALDSLVGCRLPAEALARTIPLHRAARMAANARKASELLADLADQLERRL
jgi:hypothetical protein